MAISAPFKNIVYDGQRAASGIVPTVVVASDSEAYGTITMDLPTPIDTTAVALSTASVYNVIPPSTGDPRWIRDSTNRLLDSTGCLYFTGLFTSVPQYQISWRFIPTALGDATNGSFWSAEFGVNLSDGTAANTKQLAPKVILKIKDSVSS